MTDRTRLAARGLEVAFSTRAGMATVVHAIDITLERGQTVALVGESGSGKSVTSLALMRLLPPPPRARIRGSVLFHGPEGDPVDLLRLPEEAMRRLRGDRIAMIFQEPLTCLNPVLTVGEQIAEALLHHRDLGRRAALSRARGLLEMAGVAEARSRLRAYPHQLSGGTRQRVMIAMALALEPDILIADEPTTALDVTVQAQILDLLRDLQERTGTSLLFITHNMGVVAEIADRVQVIYAGRIVEEGPTAAVLTAPLMPYTKGLLGSIPRIERAGLGGGALSAIEGFVPDPASPPQGCPFHPRCAQAEVGICDALLPPLEPSDPLRRVRCARWRELASADAAL